MEKTVTISRTEYEDLIQSREILDALYAAGVDNWEGYQDALGDQNEDEEADSGETLIYGNKPEHEEPPMNRKNSQQIEDAFFKLEVMLQKK